MSSSSSSLSSDSDRKVRRRQLFKLKYMRRRKIYHNILKLMREFLSDDETFIHNFGINKIQFGNLQNMLSGQINRILSKFRHMKPIRGRDCLGLCLRFLATGKSFRELSDTYNLQIGIIETIIREVCIIIIQNLRPLAMPHPTKQLWENVAMGYRTMYNMPNCLGSLNGRYLNIMNQKLYILLVLVDANYKFIMIDVGDYDLNTDTIWDNSEMARRFKENELQIPSPEPAGEYPLPYVVVGGNSFPAKPYLLTKYKDRDCEGNAAYRVFNRRITPVKEIGEEAMARLRRRWRILQCAFPVPPVIVERIILAACCLENYFSSPPI